MNVSATLSIRLEPKDARSVRRAAKLAGFKHVSVYARKLLLEGTDRDLAQAEHDRQFEENGTTT
jgi:hypothetical protein